MFGLSLNDLVEAEQVEFFVAMSMVIGYSVCRFPLSYSLHTKRLLSRTTPPSPLTPSGVARLPIYFPPSSIGHHPSRPQTFAVEPVRVHPI